MDSYKAIIDKAVAYGKAYDGSNDDKVTKAVDKMFVLFGVEILKVVPGRVSTEVDARLSFNKGGGVISYTFLKLSTQGVICHTIFFTLRSTFICHT